MPRSLKWISLLAIFMLACISFHVQADDTQHGGEIIEGGFGGFASFNPLFESNPITKLLFPDFIGVDPDTGYFQKAASNALATDWTISSDGRIYSFKLRDDWQWSDNTPITSADVLYAWAAINSGVVDTPLAYLKDHIAKVEAPDSTTVHITFTSADCSALNVASALPVLPSHILPTDFTALNTNEFNTKPSVGGRFQLSDVTTDHVVLRANPNWPGSITSYTYQYEADQTQLFKDFTDGKLDVVTSIAPELFAPLRSNTKINTYTYAGNTWDTLALNYADPLHPTNGQDHKGKSLDQGHHPLFGDVRVRQAIARAIDVDSLIKNAAEGEATRMASVVIPSSWAYNHELQPIAYDLTEAKRLLDEAGWIDDDGDPSTPRVAKGAKYAPDGTLFKFTLYTNSGGTRRDTAIALIRDQLHLVGLEVDTQVIDSNDLLNITNSQKFDAVLFGWHSSYPDDSVLPDLSPASDVIGRGLNITSYNNPEVTDLNTQALSLAGCNPQARAHIYGQVQTIMQQDLPYIWLYSLNEMYAAQKTVKGFDPHPNQPYWNIDQWSKAQP